MSRNQFEDSNERIVIEDKYGTLAKMIRALEKKGCHYYQEREINLNNNTCQGVSIYNYVRDLANKLIKDSKPEL